MSRWGHLWGRGRREQEVRQAIAGGELYSAAHRLGQIQGLRASRARELHRQLTQALVNRSQERSIQGDLAGAWKDMMVASSIATDRDLDRLAQEKSQLVETTVESADRLLAEGKLSSVLRVIRELRVRGILDWRADQIERSARLVQAAEGRIARGELTRAMDDLMEARNLRPDVAMIRDKLEGVQMRKPQFRALRDALRRALLKQQWPEVERTCREILEIAPNYQVALDARRQLVQRDASEPLQLVRNPGPCDRASRSAMRIRASQTRPPQPFSGEPVNHSPAPKTGSNDAQQCFMLWVDGVGGYRVCPARENWIGQAVADSHVSIPLRGDLLRRHAKIEAVERAQVLEPFGDLQLDGQPVPGPAPLKDGQSITLGPIRLKFRQPHPLSGSAALTFQTRHRTEPWSDGVLLVNGPLMLGRGRKNHVVCRNWQQDLMLFQRNGKWWVKTSGKIEVDGEMHEGEAEIAMNSRIIGDDFSLSLEAL